MLLSRPPKTQYSEVEAAEILGVTVDQLRTLVKSHIVKEESDEVTLAIATFQPSDLLLLKILAAREPHSLAS
jgi:hypothetical protein